jgi:putative hydrolase of the HAD superfamily
MSLNCRGYLFDAGGVLVLPDTAVMREVLRPYGASNVLGRYVRAHYLAMAAKSRIGADEDDWDVYHDVYVESVGVVSDERVEAAYVLGRSKYAHMWREPIESSVRALRHLQAADVPIGVVSNASGQVEAALRRGGVCQVGDGAGARVACVIDSEVVGVAKPDPAIFTFGLDAIGLQASEVGYVGDSVAMDVVGAKAAGLHPILLDPFDDWAYSDSPDMVAVTRIRSLAELVID